MKYSNTKDKMKKPKKVASYLWNYAKMSGLFPDFDKKENKKGGAKK
jgi:hypothetical protein